jgi:hypothetical protein
MTLKGWNMTPASVAKLVLGQKYRVRYLYPGFRIDREAVMTLLSVGDRQSLWDQRPMNGSQSIDNEYIKSVEAVDNSMPHTKWTKVK